MKPTSMRSGRGPASSTPWRPAIGPRSLGTQRITRVERTQLADDANLLARAGVYSLRPRVVRDCPEGPCPWVSCRHHLKLDVDSITHAVKDNFPGVDVDEMAETCSLRVAARVTDGGPLPLETVGAYVNVSMERARQLEKEALMAARRRMNAPLRHTGKPNRTTTPNKGPAMTNSSTAEDSRDLQELFQAIRLVAGLKPNAVALLHASVEMMKGKLPKAPLSATETAFAKYRGSDLGEVAILKGAADANGVADRELIDRLPKERMVMLRAFAGNTDISAQAARARALGWDRDKPPTYPTATR